MFLGFTFNVFSQAPTLAISSGPSLELYGRSNHYYQVKSSTNLSQNNWSVFGPAYFAVSNNPSVQLIDTSVVKQCFFKAVSLIGAGNNSYCDTCAEHDNVNYAIYGQKTNFTITVTHPLYEVTDYISGEDWRNCPPSDPGQDYVFTAFPTNFHYDGSFDNGKKIYDNGTDYLIVNRGATFWRPQGMTVTVNGVNYGDDSSNIHFIEIGRRISGYDEWPKFFVIYCDSNVRTIPFPPLNHLSIKFGTSVIVGPAPEAFRPFADIATVNYVTSTRTLYLTYRTGGTATIKIDSVTRDSTVLKVSVNYPTENPFCTIRSMWVVDGNSDCDHIWWKDINGATNSCSIMNLPDAVGKEWFFYRQTKSIHNQSAPDVRIKLD
jgi:hypothetical protein